MQLQQKQHFLALGVIRGPVIILSQDGSTAKCITCTLMRNRGVEVYGNVMCEFIESVKLILGSIICFSFGFD